jgi:pilus assembly protein CpaB
MNKKIILWTLVLTVLTSAAVIYYLDRYQRSLDHREYMQVVVAKNTIPNRTKITDDMLEMVTIDKQYAHPNSLTDPLDAVGAVSTVRIAAGDEVLSDYIASANDILKGLAFIVPDGMRAITVPVNEVSAINYMIRPGDMVDVIATISLDCEQPDGTFKSVLQSNYVLQKVFVLATNNNLGYDGGFPDQGSSGKDTITLAVYPEHALPLALASDYGSIRLILRNPADKALTSVKPFEQEGFLRKDE